MLTPEQIKIQILEDVRLFTKECLEEETVWLGHLRWVILKRLILDEKLQGIPQKNYTKEEIQDIVREMSSKTSRGLEKIHAKYLW